MDLLEDFPTVLLDNDRKPRCRNFAVLILNNTCDLPEDRLDFVTAAPVVDFNKYIEFERSRRLKDLTTDRDKNRVEDSVQELARMLRGNNKTEILFLPRFGEFEHG